MNLMVELQFGQCYQLDRVGPEGMIAKALQRLDHLEIDLPAVRRYSSSELLYSRIYLQLLCMQGIQAHNFTHPFN